jgi:hypothetical protein
VTLHAKDLDKVKSIMDALQQEPVARVVGVYALPTKRDQVCRGFIGGCRKTAWTRDDHGRIIHSCGGRAKNWSARLRGSLFDLLGINLLPRERTPALFQNPEGWDTPTKR